MLRKSREMVACEVTYNQSLKQKKKNIFQFFFFFFLLCVRLSSLTPTHIPTGQCAVGGSGSTLRRWLATRKRDFFRILISLFGEITI
jgi:hypothetical protein